MMSEPLAKRQPSRWRSAFRRDRAVVAGVVLHLLLSLAHGAAHAWIPVWLPAWQGAYVGLVIVILPVVGVVLLITDKSRTGYWLILLAGLAGFAFEGLFHFVIENPDHVWAVTTHTGLFTSTAFLTTAGDLVLVAVVARALWR